MITRKLIGYGFLAVLTTLALAALFLTGCEQPIDEPAHVHQWGAWDVTLAANCTTAGSQTRTCTLDATHTETEAIPINDDHDWGEWEGTVTCTEGGTGTRVCSRSETHTQTDNNLQPLGHAYNDEDWEETEPPTCTVKGKEEANCIRYAECGNTATREIAIDPEAHDWQVTSGTAPTCTTDGNGVEICSYNNEHERSGVLPKLGHDYQWVTATAPTCTTAGSDNGTCTHDNSHTTTRTVAIVPTAHNWNNNYTVTTPANCTTTGIETDTCSYNPTEHTRTQIIAIDSTAHNWKNTYTVTTPANCTTTGIETDTCTRNATHTRTQIIAVNADAHDYQWTVTTAATATTDGQESGVCRHNNSHTSGNRTLYATGTAGLEYDLIDNNTAYSVSKGTANTNGSIHIPAFYRPVTSTNYADYLPVKVIGNTTFYFATITAVTFEEGSQLTTIGQQAFWGCTSLTSVTIPDSVTTIGNGAFGNCQSLPSITIPTGVTSIDQQAFMGCRSLTSIIIPESVTTISNSAFSYCSSLTSITIPASVTTIGNGAFGNCQSLPSITIPASVTSIGQSAFQNCTSLASITIPASVSSIDQYAFAGCTILTSVKFEGSITQNNFNSWAFGTTGANGVGYVGDLWSKYLAAGGGIGTYTRSGSGTTQSPYVWTKQP